MSFGLYIAPLASWSEADRRTIVEILSRGGSMDASCYSVHYPDGSCALEIFGLDPAEWKRDETAGISFSRFGGPTFLSRLFEVADTCDAMIFWPGDPPFVVVTRDERFARLPPELKPGEATVVRDADHLWQCIKG